MLSDARRAHKVLLALSLVGVLALVGCSKDSDDAATTTTPSSTTAAAGRTTSTVARSTSTTQAPIITTTVVKPTGGPSKFRGVVDGQPKVIVTFTKGTALTDVKADGLEIQCQPLEQGDAKTDTVDVAIASAPIAADGTVSYTQAKEQFEPNISGTFTDDGRFAGVLTLSGERKGYACGGEYTFIAVHG